jgi:hypothetical protein
MKASPCWSRWAQWLSKVLSSLQHNFHASISFSFFSFLPTLSTDLCHANYLPIILLSFLSLYFSFVPFLLPSALFLVHLLFLPSPLSLTSQSQMLISAWDNTDFWVSVFFPSSSLPGPRLCASFGSHHVAFEPGECGLQPLRKGSVSGFPVALLNTHRNRVLCVVLNSLGHTWHLCISPWTGLGWSVPHSGTKLEMTFKEEVWQIKHLAGRSHLSVGCFSLPMLSRK